MLALFPELTDVNGDARNAVVLSQRARWAGLDARVVAVRAGEAVPSRPSAVVLGTTTDPALPALIAALRGIRDELAGWLADGIPLLAVGTGLEALSRGVRLPDGRLEGLDLIPGEAEPLAARVAGDLVVRAAEGDLVGYENHTRGLRLDPGTEPLGTVVRGVGDGRGVDGVRVGSIVGTRLHGPVLAKNPALADAILSSAFGRPVAPGSAEAQAVDAVAARLRAALLAS